MKNTLWNIAVGAAFVFAVFGLTYTPALPPQPINEFEPLTEEQLHIAGMCLGLSETELKQQDSMAVCRFISE